VYAVVALLLVVRLLYMYVRIVAILRSGVRDDISSYVVGSSARLIVHNADYKPFSWFGWVSISRADLDDCGREILTHEDAHVQCGHSYDILFADLIIILQWFNPMAWIMKGLLKDIHEYEADSAVLTAGVDAKSYQLLIIKKAVGARLYSIANSFNHSLTKKRITMMYKEKSSLWRCTKALYIVPLAVLAACGFSSPKSEAEDKGNEKIVNTATDGEISNLDVQVARDEKEVAEVLIALKEPEVAAEYPGGTPALMRFLSTKVKYPKEAEKRGEQGKTYVKFVVMSDGNVDYVQIAKSSGSKTLDDEAVRVVKSMPRWTPAKHNGENVNSMLTLPVAFKLGDVPTVSVSAPEGEKEVADVKITAVDEEIYQVVEQMPEFKGGMQALMKYLTSNINYPQEAKDKNIQGKSLIRFVVEKDGSITDVEVARSSGNDLLDQESVRVVKSMPKWNPGKQKGKVVRTRFVLPVMFRLQ
jgi:TonB family protein